MNGSGTSAQPPSSGSYPAVLVLVVVSTLLGMIAYSGPLGNAATLNAAFDATPAGATWLLSSMSAALAATLLAAGVVADRIGRRRVFLLGSLVFVVANVLSACSGGVVMFVVSRLLVGVGTTGMIATGLGLVAATGAGPARQAKTATWWSVAMGLGVAFGPMATGALDLVDAWPLFYVILAVCGLVVWGAALRIAPKDRLVALEDRRTFDPVGFVLLLAFLGVLIAAIIEARAGVTPFTIGLFVAAAALLVALVLSQRYGRRQLIDPALLAHRPFLASVVAALATGLGMIGTLSFSATFLVGGVGITTFLAGMVTLCWAITSVIAALGLARFTARISGEAQLVIGLLAVTVGLLILLDISEVSQLWRYSLGLCVAGAATGLLNTGLARQAVATVPAKDVATGTAANNTARYIGAAVGMSAASIVSAGDLIGGWNAVIWGGVGSSVIGALLVLLLSRRARAATAGAAMNRQNLRSDA